MKYERGSITVFLSLTIVMIASLIFTLLESARLHGLEAQSDMEGELLIESKMAAYQKELYENYHLYFLEVGQEGIFSLTGIESDMAQEGMDNLTSEALSFYRMNLTEAVVTGYELATDASGVAFMQQAADYMKQNLLVTGVEELYQHATQTEQMADDTGNVDEKMDTAETELERAQQEKDSAKTAEGEPEAAKGKQEAPDTTKDKVSQAEIDKAAKMDNPLDYAKDLKNKAILSLVVEDTNTVSGLSMEKDDSLMARTCQQGNYGESDSLNMMDTIFFKEYLMREFGNYTSGQEDTALQYELEYLIAGKYSDQDNLTAVVERLVGIREVVNYLYLRADPEKYALSYTMALAIAGISVNPLIIAAVREGILAAWAFTESVEDVKTLLAGGKISLIKSKADWNLDVENLSQSFEESEGTSSTESGLSYEDYLRILLYMTGKDELSMRALDLIEKNVRLESGENLWRMDYMINSMSTNYVYEAEPLFFGLFLSGEGWNGSYHFQVTKEFGYT